MLPYVFHVDMTYGQSVYVRERRKLGTVPMISPAQYVIGKFGGLTATSKAISVPITTVQGWAERGRIPQDHWKALIGAAKTKDKLLTFEDFLTDHPEPAQEASAA